jgi:hypothetical protein
LCPFKVMRKLILVLIAALLCGQLSGQQLVFPDGDQWKAPYEGQQLNFQVRADSAGAKFTMQGPSGPNVSFDSLGNFSWTPAFEVVDRLEKQKEFTVIFQAEWKNGKRARTPITFLVTHRNRPPVVEDLPVFYVKQASANSYQIPAEYVSDADGDPLVYKSIPSALPEGAAISSLGQVTWTLSRNQFASLKANPAYIEFIVQDPDKSETRGKIKVAQTQLDLPPEMLVLPGDTLYTIKEDERVNIKLYVTDPNGDDNIANVSFVSSDSRLTPSSLSQNSTSQSEFTWSPGYYFVEEAEKERIVEITFFAIDKASNRVQKKVRVKVKDTENLEEKDKFLYQKYRSSLVQAKALIVELDENHESLNKAYKKAKKGKKQRSLVNAGLGATTGLSPLMAPESSKTVAAVGGTTVLTLGTLEATEVIGKSKTDILDKLKTNVEIRNQLQIEGDNFARKYSLKSARRSKEFDTDRQKLYPIINNQKLVLLELDASKPSMPEYSNKEIKSTFPDFGEE